MIRRILHDVEFLAVWLCAVAFCLLGWVLVIRAIMRMVKG